MKQFEKNLKKSKDAELVFNTLIKDESLWESDESFGYFHDENKHWVAFDNRSHDLWQEEFLSEVGAYFYLKYQNINYKSLHRLFLSYEYKATRVDKDCIKYTKFINDKKIAFEAQLNVNEYHVIDAFFFCECLKVDDIKDIFIS